MILKYIMTGKSIEMSVPEVITFFLNWGFKIDSTFTFWVFLLFPFWSLFYVTLFTLCLLIIIKYQSLFIVFKLQHVLIIEYWLLYLNCLYIHSHRYLLYPLRLSLYIKISYSQKKEKDVFTLNYFYFLNFLMFP